MVQILTLRKRNPKKHMSLPWSSITAPAKWFKSLPYAKKTSPYAKRTFKKRMSLSKLLPRNGISGMVQIATLRKRNPKQRMSSKWFKSLPHANETLKNACLTT